MKENQQKQKLFCQEKKNNKRTKNYIYIMVLMEISFTATISETGMKLYCVDLIFFY